MSHNMNMEKEQIAQWSALLEGEGLGVLDTERASQVAEAHEDFNAHWLPIYDPKTGRLADGCRRRGFVKLD